MEKFYHGTTARFEEFDLSHVLEGDGKVKFGYGVYVTSQYTTAAHYSYKGAKVENPVLYVYTVEIPQKKEDNYIAFKEAVNEKVLQRTEEKLGIPVPDKFKTDGKDFRKWLARHLNGKVDLAGEKAAAEFLESVGVECIVWPCSWTNPSKGENRAILTDSKVKIIQIDEIELDAKKKLVPGSEKTVWKR